MKGKKMNKKAEEAALKAYPPDIMVDPVYWGIVANPPQKDFNLKRRSIFIKGYKQAEKDTVERVIEWLESHSNDYIFKDDYMGKEELKISGKMFEDLKKAMEK